MKCIFCDFISGKKKNNSNSFPFMILHESKYSISFLSIDFPAKEDGHTIVIPKKHYSSLENIPKAVLSDLINHVKLIVKILRKKHRGCNILLNDGKSAGQYIPHTHFHIVPRDEKDGIKIESWKKKYMSLKKFENLYKELKKEIRKNK